MSELERLIKRGEALLERVETLLPPTSRAVDWQASIAFRWRKTSRRGFIQPVANLHRGDAHSVVWTCDLSIDYVKINADYRS